jgi:hypothetical protein
MLHRQADDLLLGEGEGSCQAGSLPLGNREDLKACRYAGVQDDRCYMDKRPSLGEAEHLTSTMLANGLQVHHLD